MLADKSDNFRHPIKKSLILKSQCICIKLKK